MKLLPLQLLGAAVAGAISDLTPETEAVCDALIARYPRQVVWDPIGPNGIETVLNQTNYFEARTAYWNSKSADNRAACTFFPSNAQDVSFAVKRLNEHPSVRFALKGGGHNPNLGWSSVDEGVLIAFRPNSMYAMPSVDGSTVDVGAGCKWEDVYAAVQPLGKSVVGGRLGDVGVMGFTLGGGLSYLSAQYGLAADNVVNFEVVLANGTITNANATSNPELFFSLKGGGNQYAIVAKMTLRTHDVGVGGMVWGGTRTYAPDKAPALLAAISNFTSYNDDPKAAIIPTFNFFGTLGLNIPAIIVFYFYDSTSPQTGVFDELDAILPATSDTRTQTYEKLTEAALAGEIEGLRFQIRENTFPALPVPSMSAFLEDHYEMMLEAAAKGSLENPLDFRLMTMAVQPLTRLIVQASEDRGGNALGLRVAHGDRIWVEYDIAWLNPICDSKCPLYLRDVTESIHDMHVEKYGNMTPTHYESGDLDFIKYNPIFMNDAMYDQDPLRSYGQDNYERLRATHEAYDPDDFLSTRQGGWTFLED